jgi:AraC family transcriptional regulator
MTSQDLYRLPLDEKFAVRRSTSYSELLQRRHRSAVRRVTEYMRTNFAEPITLRDLAKVANCSPWHLDRIFAEAIGLTPMKYLYLLRIEMAKLSVLSSDQRIIEIAYDVGYNSLGSFGKRFTALVGMSPRQLRKAADGFDGRRWRSALEQACAMQFSPPSAPSISGAISWDVDCAGADGWSLIAAVTSEYPSAQPTCCTVAHVPGPFHLAPLIEGRYKVMAIAFPHDVDAVDILTQRASPRARIDGVRITQQCSSACLDIVLHAPQPADAPLTPSYAVLFEQYLYARGRG